MNTCSNLGRLVVKYEPWTVMSVVLPFLKHKGCRYARHIFLVGKMIVGLRRWVCGDKDGTDRNVG